MLGNRLEQLHVQRRCESGRGAVALVCQNFGCLNKFFGVRLFAVFFGRGSGEQGNTLEHHQFFVNAGSKLYLGVVVPGFILVRERANLKLPNTLLLELNRGVPAICSGCSSVHPCDGEVTFWVGEQQFNAESIVPFAK